MRGETVAEGGRKHACPVGVSKIRARRSVESLLKRPLAEILSSTAPAVVLVKEDSRRSTAPVAKEVSRRRKPHRSMRLHARTTRAAQAASTARYLLSRLPQRQGSQNRDRMDHGLLASRPRLAATGRHHDPRLRSPVHTYNGSGGAPGAFSTCARGKEWARPLRFWIGRPAPHGALNRRAARGASRHQRRSASSSWITTCRLALGLAAASQTIAPAPPAARTTRQANGSHTRATTTLSSSLARRARVAALLSHLLGTSRVATRTAKIAGAQTDHIV